MSSPKLPEQTLGRRTACVFLPRFRMDVEERVRPDPLGRPIAVFDPGERLRSLLESPKHGPAAGMPLREAQSRWPEVAYRADTLTEYAQELTPVLDVLTELSPTVEWTANPAQSPLVTRHSTAARYAVFLDASGLAALYGSEARLRRLIADDVRERTGHTVQVGIADGRYAAWLASHHDETVPAGGDAAYLAPLPVTSLPLPSAARERIAALGARTLHEFSRWPPNAIRHRFGADGVAALALAAGHDQGPLRPRSTPLQLHDALDLEWVETSLDRLLFLLKRLADRLSVRLAHHGLGCGRLRVVWLVDESGLTTGDDIVDAAASVSGACAPQPDNGAVVSVIRLAEPSASGASLLEHLRWHVDGLRPETFRDPRTGQQRGVRGLQIEAEELAPLAGRQLALLPGADGRASDPERLLAAQRAVARLTARWGEAGVRQATPVASRRPERAFALCAPAIQVTRPGPERQRGRGQRPRVTTVKEAPRHQTPSSHAAPPLWLTDHDPVTQQSVQVHRGGRQPNGRRRPGTITQDRQVRRIVRAAGPWRLVERWATEPVARDSYHVVFADGAACWLAHDRLADRWFVLGTFD